MIAFRRESDGTWTQLPVPFCDQDRVSIQIGSGRFDRPFSSTLITRSVPAQLGGQHSYADAIDLIQTFIAENPAIPENTIMIEDWDRQVVSDAFDAAAHDRLERHRHELVTMQAVLPGFHDYRIEIYRIGSDQPFMERVGCLELVGLIRDRLRARFGGKISDPGGNILEDWEAA